MTEPRKCECEHPNHLPSYPGRADRIEGPCAHCREREQIAAELFGAAYAVFNSADYYDERPLMQALANALARARAAGIGEGGDVK